MINFMCHTHLTIKLGPSINFIIGHNGSGKSAVLTALTISLGGKAAATNRGASLKSFIQNGKDQATLIVKIKNQGDNGYRQEEYGDSIIVERQFSRAGSSRFKIKSQAGKIVSTKRGDVDDITDYYGLQIDNPLTVLTQDMARQFLCNSTPAEKYKFFVRGVQLEQLEQDYALVQDQLEAFRATNEEREAYVQELHQELQKALNDYRATSSLSDYMKKLDVYRMKLVWALVVAQERKESHLRRKLQGLQEKIRAAEDEADDARLTFDQATVAMADAEQLFTEAKQERSPILEEQKDVNATREQLKIESSDLLHDQRLARDQVKNIKDKIVRKRTDIDGEERRLEEQNGGGYARRAEELENKRHAAKIADDKTKEHVQKELGLKNNIKQVDDALLSHKTEREPFQIQIEASERQISELRSTNSRDDAYGPKMPQLLRAIQSDQGYKVKPIGPMGNYIHLKKPEWSNILEKFFGNSLNGFIVHHKSDQERLTTIMRQLKCTFPVSIVTERELDYRQHEPDPKFDTVLGVLDIDHPAIINYMILNHNVEQVILIEDMRVAREIMFGERIKNVKACFSFQTNDSTNGERWAYASSGITTTFAEGWTGKPRMKTQVQGLLDHQNKILDQQRQALHQYDGRLSKLREDVEKAKQALTLYKREAHELREAANRAEEDANDLQASLEQGMPQQGRLDQLKKDLQELEDERVKHENIYGQCVVALDAIKAKRQEDFKRTKDLPARIAVANRKVDDVEIRFREVQNVRSNALVKKNELFAAKEELERERDDPDSGLMIAINRVKEIVGQFIAHATEYGDRVPIADNENPTNIKAMYEKIENDINVQEARLGGSAEQLQAAYERAKAKHDQTAQLLQSDKELQTMLMQTLHKRRERWHQFRRHITFRARLNFQHLLSNRAFRGVLRVDHRLRLLDIEVQPDETQAGKGKRAAKTLSGGEKSFSQICLIVALWEAIGAPIRCLDEFDVFMDNVNRDLAMKLLIDAARNSHGQQFILITPQSMSSLAEGTDVKVHK